MDANIPPLIQQYVFHGVALVQLILAVYFLVFNFRNTINRHVAFLLFLYTLNGVATGLLVTTTDIDRAQAITMILAATVPAINPATLITWVVILKPDWLRNRWRRVWWIVYGLILLPASLLILDNSFGTQIYYTGLDPAIYSGGFVLLSEYARGVIAYPIRLSVNLSVIPVFFIIIIMVFRDKESSILNRRLAYAFLALQIIPIVLFSMSGVIGPVLSTLIISILFTVVFSYIVFNPSISTGREVRGSLLARLTLSIVAVTIPLLIAITTFSSVRVGALFDEAAVYGQATRLAESIQRFQQITLVMVVLSLTGLLVFIWLTLRRALQPLNELTAAARRIAEGDLSQMVNIAGSDEMQVLSLAFNQMTTQLQEIVGNLEQRVIERTRALEVSTEIGRRLSTILDGDQLVREVVEQLQVAYGFYHVQIYLRDEAQGKLVMVGGTGEVGEKLVADGHSLPLGKGLVGQAAETNSVVRQTRGFRGTGWLPNPLLPETESELAIPITLGGEVLGVLDVQHNLRNAFGTEEVYLIQSIASQVAIGLQNAQAYSNLQKQAEREAQLAAINQRIQAATTVDDALQVAISELGQALGAKMTQVEIGLPVESPR